MIGRLLCKLGQHRWPTLPPDAMSPGTSGQFDYHCRRCNKYLAASCWYSPTWEEIERRAQDKETL